MRLLLDSHIAVWVVTGDSRLSPRAQALMTDAETVFVSAVTIWEIAIKHALGRSGRSRMPFAGREAIAEFRAAGFEFLNITPEHAAAVGELRDLHGDPFDRLLVAQAMSEPLILLTHDRAVAAYGDTVVLV